MATVTMKDGRTIQRFPEPLPEGKRHRVAFLRHLGEGAMLSVVWFVCDATLRNLSYKAGAGNLAKYLAESIANGLPAKIRLRVDGHQQASWTVNEEGPPSNVTISLLGGLE